MIVLGIETSCDETSVALVEDGKRVLAEVTASSVQEQAKYGGVFPEVAARRQLEYIVEVVGRTVEPPPSPLAPLRAPNLVETNSLRTRLEECDSAEGGTGSPLSARLSHQEQLNTVSNNFESRAERGGGGERAGTPQIDAISVTRGPGLLTSLLVGTTAARTLASIWKKPLIGVHHTLGHLSSPWLECDDDIEFPILALSVSGGHSEIWLRESHTQGKLIGKTRDDAAGEAFDKGAALLGLPYPGGPAISKLAEGGNPHYIEFPRPLAGEETLGFSFSGLKTSLKYALRDRGGVEVLSEAERKDVAASFQEAVCRHLVDQIVRALEEHDVRELHLVGGVAANGRLREMLKERCGDVKMRIPPLKYCTDNAAMIAAAGYFMSEELGDEAYERFETEASVRLA